MNSSNVFNIENQVKDIKTYLGDSSDIRVRDLTTANDIRISLLYIDGIVDISSIQEHIMDPVLNKSFTISQDRTLSKQIQSVVEITTLTEIETVEEAGTKLLDGCTIILNEEGKDILVAQTEKWENRAVTSPKGQRAVEGPDIGFTESMSTNVALIRKIVKNPKLTVETKVYGENTNTSASLIYLKGMVDEEILSTIKQKLEEISLKTVLGSNYISEYLTKESQSFFPLVLNSDRPDVAAGEILEGRVCIIVDGSPYVLIAPALFYQFFQSSDDYHISSQSLKLVRPMRFILFWIAAYMPAFYIAITTYHKGLLPVNLLIGFLAQQEAVPFTGLWEVILVIILTGAIFEASSRLPQAVIVTISLFGAIVFGQSSIEAQIVQPITLAVVSSSYILSSIVPIASMEYAARFLKFGLVFVGALLGLYGLALVTLALLVHLCSLRSFGVPYMSPLAPFKWVDISRDVFTRKPIPTTDKGIPIFHKEEQMKGTSEERK